MKQFLLVCAAVLVTSAVHAQKLKEAEVPAVVKDSFTKNFPGVKNVAWAKENESEFEAEFKTGSVEKSANFDTAGNWLATETEIKKTDLPAGVLATIKKDFNGFKIEEAEKVEKADLVYYETELEKGKLSFEVDFSRDGKVLRKTENKKEKKD